MIWPIVESSIFPIHSNQAMQHPPPPPKKRGKKGRLNLYFLKVIHSFRLAFTNRFLLLLEFIHSKQGKICQDHIKLTIGNLRTFFLRFIFSSWLWSVPRRLIWFLMKIKQNKNNRTELLFFKKKTWRKK